jgi:hypothetical protein
LRAFSLWPWSLPLSPPAVTSPGATTEAEDEQNRTGSSVAGAQSNDTVGERAQAPACNGTGRRSLPASGRDTTYEAAVNRTGADARGALGELLELAEARVVPVVPTETWIVRDGRKALDR